MAAGITGRYRGSSQWSWKLMYSDGCRAERLTVFHMECAYTRRRAARRVRASWAQARLREDEEARLRLARREGSLV